MLKHTDGRIVISIDLESKNSHRFSDGTVIRLERQVDNFNRRYTEPVNAIVVSAKDIPSGVEILIHPNGPTETNQIFNYKKLSGKETSSSVKYYSIPEEQCFIWKDEHNEWQPIFPYQTALRVFKPYNGILEGIEPSLLKDTLYVTSGELKGQVVVTIPASDYQIVFQDSNGREGNIIRFRPDGDEKHEREPEAIAILHKETKMVKEGKLLVGISKSDAKPINKPVHA